MLKQKKTLYDRKKLKPLGTHTAVGHLYDLGKWKDVPYLRENHCMLPPFMICVGSRVRVMKAKEILKLRDSVFIDEYALKKFGTSAYGRVSILVGIAESGGIDFPISVVETQMGCPATQINMHELLYFTRQGQYSYNNKIINGKESIYVVRAGTCAGVNSDDPFIPSVSIGDVAIANFNIGAVGAIIQSYLGILDFVGRSAVNAKKELLKAAGFSGDFESSDIILTKDKKYLITKCSDELVGEFKKVVKLRNISFAIGPNFTKDSLYAEMGEKEFVELNKKYGVISTEMEQLVIDFLAKKFTLEGISIKTGLISAVIGAIPGKSFPTTEKEKKAAKEAEEKILLITKEVFGRIALSSFDYVFDDSSV
ncbi:MAG: hypothetical protein QW153_01525 [Candidatus Bilamarchaeaceae archaeon]